MIAADRYRAECYLRGIGVTVAVEDDVLRWALRRSNCAPRDRPSASCPVVFVRGRFLSRREAEPAGPMDPVGPVEHG